MGTLSPVNHYTYITFMAKGSAMGLWKGKKGSSVFYKIKNSNSAQKQGIRERVYEVANPKTASQATQRMKMLPAQRIANILKEVIERGFEGVPYGVQSRQAFLKYALKMTSGVPATDKDASNVYPGKYLIAKGQLPEIVVSDGDRTSRMITSLRYNTEEALPETRGDVSALLLSGNSFLKVGDQITIITCCFAGETLDGAALLWNQNSYYIDPDGSEEIGEYFNPGIASSEDGQAIIYSRGSLGDETLLAAAVIISRESVTGGHLRSNAVLHINSAFETELFGAAALSRARKSYQNSSVSNSDWPVDPDAEGEVDPERIRFARLTIDTTGTNAGVISVDIPSMRDLEPDDVELSSSSNTIELNLPVGVPFSIEYIEGATAAVEYKFNQWMNEDGTTGGNPYNLTITGATNITLDTDPVERG